MRRIILTIAAWLLGEGDTYIHHRTLGRYVKLGEVKVKEHAEAQWWEGVLYFSVLDGKLYSTPRSLFNQRFSMLNPDCPCDV
jgi:hypothetical protein